MVMPANLIKTLNFITEILLNLVGLFLFLFTTTVFLQVLTRFVIQIPLAWTEEVSRYFFIWMVFLGSAVGIRKGLHYQIFFLLDGLGAKTKKNILKGVDIIVLLFFFLVLVHSLDFWNLLKINRSPALAISMAIPYTSVVCFGIFGFVFSLENVFKSFLGRRG